MKTKRKTFHQQFLDECKKLGITPQEVSNRLAKAFAYEGLKDCHDCKAKPGEVHKDNCDVERCSVCGGQYIQCHCSGHDKKFAHWTGIWPGKAEATYLGMDLNQFEIGPAHIFFVKPKK